MIPKEPVMAETLHGKANEDGDKKIYLYWDPQGKGFRVAVERKSASKRRVKCCRDEAVGSQGG